MKTIIFFNILLISNLIFSQNIIPGFEDNFILHKNKQLSDEMMLKLNISNLAYRIKDSKVSYNLRRGNFKIQKMKKGYMVFIYDKEGDKLLDKYYFQKK